MSLIPTPSAHDHHIGYQNRNNGKKGTQVNLETIIIDDLRADIPTRGGKFLPRISPLSQVASLVSPSHTPDEEQERMTTAISGQKCLEQYNSSNPSGSLQKMCEVLLLGQTAWYSRQCALTWKAKVTKSNRLLFQLSPSVRPIEGTGSGSSAAIALTPTASESVMDLAKFKARMEKYPNGTTMPNLATQINTLPTSPLVPKTPSASDAEGGIMEIRPGTTGKYKLRDIPNGLAIQTGQETGRKLRLQPAMTQWMMGYPDSWTEFPCLDLSGGRTASKPTETES